MKEKSCRIFSAERSECQYKFYKGCSWRRYLCRGGRCFQAPQNCNIIL